MFRDKLSTFKLACRLARWLCADPERSLKAKSNKDTMKRLKSIHSVLARKAKMISTSQHRNGKSSKKAILEVIVGVPIFDMACGKSLAISLIQLNSTVLKLKGALKKPSAQLFSGFTRQK